MRPATRCTLPTAPEWMTAPLSKALVKVLGLKRCGRCRKVKPAAAGPSGKATGCLWSSAAFYPGHWDCKGCRRAYKKSPEGIEHSRRYDASAKRLKVKRRYLRTAAGKRSLAHTKAMRAAREQLAGPDPTMAEARALCDAFGNLCAFCSQAPRPTTTDCPGISTTPLPSPTAVTTCPRSWRLS